MLRNPAILMICLGLILAPASTRHLVADDAPFEPALLLRLDDEGRVAVEMVNRLEAGRLPGGLLLWTDDEQDHASPLPLPASTEAAGLDLLQFAARSAGAAGSGGGTTLTRPLEQLRGLTLFKGKGFLTPAPNGVVANPRITIRRRSDDGAGEPPAATLILSRIQGGQERPLASIMLEANQAVARWHETPALTAISPEGLPPGEYTLRDAADTATSVRFTVLDASAQQAVWQRLSELKQLLGDDPASAELYRTVALSHLLSQRDEAGKPRQLLSDAFDQLDVAESELSPFLMRQRTALEAQLHGKPSPTPADSPLGIPAVDEARGLIAQSRWTEALARLTPLAESPDDRTRGLAHLYLGVITAESGPAAEEQARELFQQATVELAAAPVSDQFRVLNNAANHEFGAAQDRFFNHAFQAASGVQSPLMEALTAWQSARDLYLSARKLAEQLTSSDRATVEINLARLYALLSDVSRALSDSDAPDSTAIRLSTAAANEARQHVERATSQEDVEPLVLAEGEAVLAHLAYRNADDAECERRCTRAIRHYLEAGSLAGLEEGYRLQGLLKERRAGASPQNAQLAEALRDLQIAHALAGFLWDQVPPDQAGVSRAGFFARRAYVNERMLELAFRQQDAIAALRFAEEGKARALQSLLLLELQNDPESVVTAEDRPTVSSALADWPSDCAAIEYFLGSERGWAFVVNTSGTVTMHLLCDEDGQPISSQALVARVRTFLSGIEGQAPKMMQRLLAGRGFDHTWQDDLHRFCQILLPPAVREQLAGAKSVVVIPHHILHYFPFAALVTEPDRAPRKKSEMVQPRFLLDEPYTISYSPALRLWDASRRRPAAKFTQARAAGVVNAPGGPPLPGVEEDLANYAAALGSRVRDVLREEQATDEAVLGLLDRRGALLLASHGYNSPDAPLQSYLLLMGSGQPAETASETQFEDDSKLTAAMLYRSPVRSDLVVLSACYSGLADRSPLPGDDLFGIQRSLLQSGAKTVISGLWDVYDGTAPTLVKGFWNRIGEGIGAADALAGSQREFIETLRKSGKPEPWLHPYFWAVYTVTGDARTTAAPLK